MKKLFYLLSSAAMLLGAASCDKGSIEEEQIPSVGAKAGFVLDAQIDNNSRTTLDGRKVAWDEGDCIYLVTADGTWGLPYGDDNSGNTIATYTYTEGAFVDASSGELPTLTENEAYTVYALYARADQRSYHRAAATSHRLQATQSQDCTNPTAHIATQDALVGKFNVTGGVTETAAVTMSHIYTMMEVDVKNTTGKEVTITKFEMQAKDATLAGDFTVNYGNTVSAIDVTFKANGYDKITVDVANGTVAAGEALPIYFVMAPLTDYSGDVTFTVTDSDGYTYTKTVTVDEISFEAGKYNTTTYTISEIDVIEEKIWSLISSIDDLVDGQYVVLVKDTAGTIGYLPSDATGSNPAFGAQTLFTDLTTATYTVGVPSDMIWNFALNAENNWVLTNENGDYFFGTNTAQGLRIGSTADAWTISPHSVNASAFAFRNDDVARNAGVYITDGAGKDWRSYNGDTNNGYGADGVGAQIVLYYCGTIAEKIQLATPTNLAVATTEDSVTISWDAVEGAANYTVTCGSNEILVEETSCTITGLKSGTTYDCSVSANPENRATHSKSEAATITATTVASSLQTYSWTLVKDDLGTTGSPLASVTKGEPEITWALTFDWPDGATKSFNWDNTYKRGVQIGTGNATNKCNEFTLTGNFATNGIKKITVGAGTASSGNAVLSVTVGGTALTCSGSAGVKLNTTTTPQSYVFSSESELTGEIVITIANAANKAIYLKEIHINQ